MNKPVLSVLLPNFNNAPYLKECIDSILAQTFQDFEVFFIDDCSTDNSIEVVESYRSSKIRLLRKSKNSGIVDTLNMGLEQITSKYFIRMDGDDINAPQRFEKLVAYMETHPEIGVCTSDIQTFGIENEVIRYEKNSLQNKANLIFSHTIGHSSSIFRTCVLKENGIRYKNDYWRMEDYQLFFSLMGMTDFSCLSEVLYYYRRGEYNLNDEIRTKKLGEFKRFYGNVFKEMKYLYKESDLRIHAELAAVTLPSHNLNIYKKHIQDLLEANKVSTVFPQDELKLRLNKALRDMCFWQVDVKMISLIELMKYSFRYKNLFRYYLAKKIRGQVLCVA